MLFSFLDSNVVRMLCGDAAAAAAAPAAALPPFNIANKKKC